MTQAPTLYRDKLRFLLDWDESLHPRDDAGKFAGSGGGGHMPREAAPDAPAEKQRRTEAKAAVETMESLLPDAMRYAAQQLEGHKLSPEPPKKWAATFDHPHEVGNEEFVRMRVVSQELVKSRAADLLTERGLVAEPAGNPRLLADTVGTKVWNAWQSSSKTGLGVALQMAAAEELNTYETQSLTRDDEAMARTSVISALTHKVERTSLGVSDPGYSASRYPEFKGSPEAVQKAYDLAMGRAKAVVRAQWETAQYVLQKAGMEHVEVYRALQLPTSKVEATRIEPSPKGSLVSVEKLPDLKLKQNAVASTTFSRDLANKWHGEDVPHQEPTTRVVVRFRAPRTSVLDGANNGARHCGGEGSRADGHGGAAMGCLS